MDDLYERGFYRWTEQAAEMCNKRVELEAPGIDWMNVAEELDTLGEKCELRSRLVVLLLRLLKWLHQPIHRGELAAQHRDPAGRDRRVAVRQSVLEAPFRSANAGRFPQRPPRPLSKLVCARHFS